MRPLLFWVNDLYASAVEYSSYLGDDVLDRIQNKGCICGVLVPISVSDSTEYLVKLHIR